VGCVDVGVAETGRLDLDQDLSRLEDGARDLVDREARRELVHDGRAVVARRGGRGLRGDGGRLLGGVDDSHRSSFPRG
jgi:hypothetical protein